MILMTWAGVILHKLNRYLKPAFILVFLIYMIPRTISLGSDISNYDASFWYPRMDEFTPNVISGDYKGTYQQYHPGVTLLWVSGTSKYLFEKTFETVFKYNPRYMPHHFIKLQIASILPLVFIISILGVIAYKILADVTNIKFALIFSILLSLEPFFLGVSKYLHLSALTSMLMFTSFLTLYYFYYKKYTNNLLFYASAVLLGLGMLTKIDALISLPVNGLLIIYNEYRGKISKRLILKPIAYGLTICITFFALFPAMWVSPFWVVQKIIEEGIGETAFDSGGADTFLKIKALYYFETFFLRSTPASFITFITGSAILFLKRKTFETKERAVFYWVGFYLLFNLLILTIPEKIKDRYLINLYPPFLLMSTIAVYEVLKSKIKFIKYGFIALLAGMYIFIAYRYHPVYSFYYTEFIGGPSGITKLGLNIKNRGEFYAQAAQYLNKTDPNPGAKSVILSHREQMRTFPPFFYGTTFSTPKLLPDGKNAEYIIVRPDMEYLIPHENCSFLKSFGPKDPFGYQEIIVYKCEGIDNQYKDFRN